MVRRSLIKEMVLDPTLPDAVLTDLGSGSGSLLVAEPGTPPRSHRFHRQRALSGAVTFCVLGTVIVTLDQAAGGWWAWPAALIGSLAYLPWNAADRRSNSDDLVARCAVMLFPWAWFPDPADLGGIERARLSRVRAVCERIEEAQRLLAPAFDGTLVLMALREEEWRLAARMREMAPPAAEVDRLKAEAATDRVREASRPQAEVVAEARKTDEAVIERVERYARPVEGAIRAHREWEQIQRLADSTDSYAGLLARTEAEKTTDGLAGAHDLDGDLTLEAVRQARQDLTAGAMEANDWLINALRGSEAR
jgi:hypothetical protein